MSEVEVISSTFQASYRKIVAGLKYAGSGLYQDYPLGVIELGIVLDALNMLKSDMDAVFSESAKANRES